MTPTGGADESCAFLLLHSPLLGPSSMEPLAAALRQRGASATVADPRGNAAAETLRWSDWPAAVAEDAADWSAEAVASGRRLVLVGHSAAGLVAPAAADRVRGDSVIFVDGRVPPIGGSGVTVPPAEPEFHRFVETLAHGSAGGRLPLWTEWWGEDALGSLMTADQIEVLRADAPELTLAWFEDEVEVPAWDRLGCGYVRLSAVFDEELRAADRAGWPVASIDGTHVDPSIAPEAVADAVESVAAAMPTG